MGRRHGILVLWIVAVIVIVAWLFGFVLEIGGSRSASGQSI